MSIEHPQVRPLTPAEIWETLQHFFKEQCVTAPQSTGGNIIAFLEPHPTEEFWTLLARIAEEFDVKGGFGAMADFFGVGRGEFGSQEWKATVAPRLTFAALIQFIDERTPKFEPVEIAGHRCASAGMFLAIRQIVENRCGTRTRFAPSTPIRDIVRGRRLRRLWERLGWWTDGGLAPLPKTWEAPFRLAWLALFSLPCLWLTWRASLWWVGGVFILEWLSRWWIAERIDRAVDPLPPNLTTFRDLSEHLRPIG